jgi:hypothetical protein
LNGPGRRKAAKECLVRFALGEVVGRAARRHRPRARRTGQSGLPRVSRRRRTARRGSRRERARTSPRRARG